MPSAYDVQRVAEDTARRARAVEEEEQKRQLGNLAFTSRSSW